MQVGVLLAESRDLCCVSCRAETFCCKKVRCHVSVSVGTWISCPSWVMRVMCLLQSQDISCFKHEMSRGVEYLAELGDACPVSLGEPGYQAAERCHVALSTWLS